MVTYQTVYEVVAAIVSWQSHYRVSDQATLELLERIMAIRDNDSFNMTVMALYDELLMHMKLKSKSHEDVIQDLQADLFAEELKK